MTNHWIDFQHADVILIMGSNAAECHPISFKWVMKAKDRGAQVLSVDPRFTRTSARSDFYTGLRSGTDIAFLGGMINHILENNKIFKEYVEMYTNASFLVDDKFSFKDGMFNGYEAEKKKYAPGSFGFKRDDKGMIARDPTLQDPRCVFQLMKAHYSRYTLEKVSSITGTPAGDLKAVYEAFAATGTRDKAGTILYALGWTQHTVGVQNIRAMSMIQLLLGNMGICGGGVNALRGEPNVQGSTDHAILYNIIPGYMPTPAASVDKLDTYLQRLVPKAGDPLSANWKQNYPKYMVSLLKAWYGDAATKDNEFCYHWLPKLDDGQAASIMHLFDLMYQGKLKGFTSIGQNPCGSLPNAHKIRKALCKLDWMAHINIFDNETASFWKGPGMDPKKIKTEVFLFPAAASMEKAGSMTNSGRLMQWKYQAVPPPGDALSIGDILFRLMNKIKALYKKEKGAFPDPVLNLVWDYGDEKGMFDPMKVVKTLNGTFTRDTTIGDKTFKKGDMVPNFTMLQADGATTSGNWIYSGVMTADGKNLAQRRALTDPTGLGLYPEWAWSWPVNRRIIYNRASVDAEGKPWNPKKPLLEWKDGKWTGDVVDGNYPPLSDKEKGRLPFIMCADGVGQLFGPGLVDGPFPEHYEPLESPLEKNPMSATRFNPTVKPIQSDMDKIIPPADPKYPIVCSTYTCTEHWATGASTRWQSWLTEAMPEVFVEISLELAEKIGVKNGEKVKVSTPRGELPCVAMVTCRFKPFTIEGKTVHQVGMTFNYGWLFPKDCGDTANLLTPSVGDPNTHTPEYKAFMVNVVKA
jgi:formate dehydrogenase major subunit